jgi:hypothetical protein
LIQAFLKKWWVESDFKGPNLPLSLRLKGKVTLPEWRKIHKKKSNMEAPNRVGDENNNVILNDPPANYISHVEIYFGFKIITIIGADDVQR